ncbi:MAG: UDP-N-acetylmuramoyl-L-alanine--D-glutamate ligase [Paludibacteraceae bacterium]|nr:UDP-N-acetylmuramoyl-L-alanine--D-glutamate ligase [Paludibacteraceae bacterium]
MKRRIVVLGGGESGAGAAILAKKEDFDIFLSDYGKIKPEYKAVLDKHGIEWEEETHTEEKILSADEIIKSPGIPESAPIIKKIKEKGIHIISEIEFAGRYAGNAKMICITGSNGKTTTTMLTYHILKDAGLNVGLAGNVGKSLALQVAEGSHDCYVIELSSFQLDNMYDFKADIAILLNITPDHLDRYEYKFQNYVNSKFRIVQNQTVNDVFIYWSNDPVIRKELEQRNIPSTKYAFDFEPQPDNCAFIDHGELIIKTLNHEFRMLEKDLALHGRHNLYNSMAAGISACVMNIGNDEISKSLNNFTGVEHRLEYVATVRGIKFINDSKATNVNSCWYALQSMTTPVVLILGGKDKGNDYSEIENLVKEKVHTIVCMGKDNHKIIDFFKGKCPRIIDTHSVEDAVRESYMAAKKGDTVLLSPCCASFDLFTSYEDRGTQFKNIVRKL